MQPDERAGGAADEIGAILPQLVEADFERLEPPAELWGRIDAAVAAGPKQPPSREPGAGAVVEYWIDADDVVSAVGGSWADFARENHAAELSSPSPDRKLWTYFGREEIREVWQLLVARVRATQAEARVPLRCDAPDTRRWFEMTITPAPDGTVHFRSVPVFEESRRPVALLDPHADRDHDAEPVPLCSWCGRGHHESQWLEIEELVRSTRLLERESMPPLSYGICASCRDDMAAELLVPDAIGGTAP